ncbi:hypothetical protein A2415_02500 [candidate division WWE3 bacterium RIFOXYC1_FULL_39_7]|uniref:Archaeal Type IV pilin N-terminal domain-containing protein n=2 Tax=Katanobacteria TaxID=422282 RepID=A0A1F4X4T6_UNCKA|nr:MAG: hypothetical protein A2415_02500 [candidate division WWE3 bacterium RIFOXYC1_FULL_39_7]OGC76163.1 MAG: hypothetical protein A2619_05605 [candidate division WWE3 bacterium RIFOXYD1_FULL_39_9]
MALGVACILLLFVFLTALAALLGDSVNPNSSVQIVRTVEVVDEAVAQKSSATGTFESLCDSGVKFVSVDSDTDDLDNGLRGSAFMVLPMDGCLVSPLFCVYTQNAGSTNGGVSCGNLLNP